jgi:hypothetical protein
LSIPEVIATIKFNFSMSTVEHGRLFLACSTDTSSIKQESNDYKKPVHCRNGRVTVPPIVGISIRDNHTKFCQEMLAMH